MDDKRNVISMDMREYIFEIVAKRMEASLQSWAIRDYVRCFNEIDGIKILISNEMADDEKKLFDSASEKIRGLIDSLSGKPSDQSTLIEKNTLFSQVPFYVSTYMEMVFKEMGKQGIWFPKTVRYDSFDTTLLMESFGLDDEWIDDKRKMVEELPKEKLIRYLHKSHIDDIYAKIIIDSIM